MKLKIHTDEILAAIASAAPPQGQPWEDEHVTAKLTDFIQGEVREIQQAREDLAAQREAAFTVQFVNAPVRQGNAAAVVEWQDYAHTIHGQQVAEKVAKNRALILGIFGGLTTVGTGLATGGMTWASAAPALLSIGRQIADALNTE